MNTISDFLHAQPVLVFFLVLGLGYLIGRVGMAGVSLGAVSSWFKFFGTELNKQRYNLLMEIHGSDALAWRGEASEDGKLARDWLRTKGNSIEGGTSEIQLNIVAKHILGLPG